MIYPARFLVFSAVVFFCLSVHGLLTGSEYQVYFDAIALGAVITYATWIYEKSGQGK